ncbi:TPA: hypothetical protein HA219_01750 [Candidatus Woesearchaeota archaeon]|nr:hypothetical protein [Candidatus Woesearchaeota archaeon]
MAYKTYVKGKVSEGLWPCEKGFTLYDEKRNFLGSGVFPTLAVKEDRLEIMVRGEKKGRFLVHFINAGGLGFFGNNSYWVPKSLVTREAH